MAGPDEETPLAGSEKPTPEKGCCGIPRWILCTTGGFFATLTVGYIVYVCIYYYASASANGIQAPTCGIAEGSSGFVIQDLSDGLRTRCASVVREATSGSKQPVLIYFHGSSLSAKTCGDVFDDTHASLGSLTGENGIALVCAESIQYYPSKPWPLSMPESAWMVRSAEPL